MPKWQKVEHAVLRPDDADPDDYIGMRSISNDDLTTLAGALGPAYELAMWLGRLLRPAL